MTKTELQTVAAPIAASLALVWVRAGKPIKPETATQIGLSAVLVATSVITAIEQVTTNE